MTRAPIASALIKILLVYHDKRGLHSHASSVVRWSPGRSPNADPVEDCARCGAPVDVAVAVKAITSDTAQRGTGATCVTPNPVRRMIPRIPTLRFARGRWEIASKACCCNFTPLSVKLGGGMSTVRGVRCSNLLHTARAGGGAVSMSRRLLCTTPIAHVSRAWGWLENRSPLPLCGV